MHVILTIFAGRERYLSILSKYLNILIDRGLLHEVHLWNYARNDDDYHYVEQLAETRTEFKVFHPDKGDIHKGWNQWSAYYDYYTTQDTYDDSDIIIKCDDDVVFIDVEKFERYIACVKHDSIYFPNIINNDVGAFIQTQNRVHRLLVRVNTDNLRKYCDIPLSMKKSGPWCDKTEQAEAVHHLFLAERQKFSLDIPLIEWWSRISINFFAMTFKTMKRNFLLFKELGEGDDEAFLSARIIRRTDKPNVIVPFFNVVHFSFGPQWTSQLDARFLPRYNRLADSFR